MSYKYETHLHTAETSKCSRCSGKDFAHYYKERGYSGVFVTDHFLNGNTTVPDDVPWRERVKLFCYGYETVADEGAKSDLDVFFAWEYSYGWTHFLTYGLGKDWLLANPDVLEWDVLTYLDRVHHDGGAIVHAHPFREGVEIAQLIPSKVDAVEIINGGRTDDFNRHAADFAASFNLAKTAGSDIHGLDQKRLCGVISPKRFADAQDYVRAIKSGEVSLFDERL